MGLTTVSIVDGSYPPNGIQLVDPATTAGAQPVGQSSGWTLSMSEEFNGTMSVVDAPNGYVTFRPGGPTWATWYPDWPMFAALTGTNHTNDNYACYYATSKVSLDGAGSLVLGCDKQQTIPGLPYTAGCIQSFPSFTTTAGWYEVRLKIANRQMHLWPAFWMSASDYNTWPPEIDIWEFMAGGGTTSSDYLTNVYGATGGDFKGTVASAPDNQSFHTYACKWDASSVTFYLDGVQTATTTHNVSGNQYLMVNNGVDDVNATFTSANIVVDYIRCWTAS